MATFVTGRVVSFKSESVFSEAFVVCVLGTAADTVKLPGATTDLPIGIVQDITLNSGDSVPVQLDGISRVIANAAITKGVQVGIAATTGRVAVVSGLDSSFDAGTATKQQPIGIALEAASAAGEEIACLIRPFFYPWG